MQLYRVISPLREQVGCEVDATLQPLSARIQRTLDLSSVFGIIVEFWQITGVQLSTAVQVITMLPLYFDKLNDALDQHKPYIDSKIINSSEKVPSIATDEVKKTAIRYLQCGVKMSMDDGSFIWEYLWELVRKAKYHNCVSRYNCLFAFESLEDANQYLKERIEENSTYAIDKICSVDIKFIEKQNSFDMRWLDNISIHATYKDFIQIADNYWSGKMTDQPFKEILLYGVYELKLL